MFQTLIDPAFLAAENGGTPVLDLNFAATKALDSRITFTRGSNATYVDSSGTLQTASSGVARFTHNPSTLQSLGLLIEGTRTNLLLNSATLSTQNVTTTAAAHTLHFTGTGTITLTGTSTAGPLVGTGTGEANRVSLTFTPTAGTLTLTVSGTVTNAQLEVGAFKTSYIPTTSATVQRSADVATMTGTNFSSWYVQNNGAFSVEFISPPNESADRRILSIGPIPASLDLVYQFTRNISIDNTTIASLLQSPNTATVGSLSKAIGVFKSGDYAVCLNGGTVATSSASNTITANSLTIGSYSGGSSYIFTSLSRIRYYRMRLPNASLQAITT
jgi:hypothetical protein